MFSYIYIYIYIYQEHVSQDPGTFTVYQEHVLPTTNIVNILTFIILLTRTISSAIILFKH